MANWSKGASTFCAQVHPLAGHYTSGAVYFQVLEQLLESEQVVYNALPHMSGLIKQKTLEMLGGYGVEGFTEERP
ncbi:hypothetical protein ACWGH4_11540 [Streptomyces sp. NPDC054847]